MAMYRILSWHDIPLGVKAGGEDGDMRVTLPLRFQVAVDAVATTTRQTNQGIYVAGFRWSPPVERPGSARDVAQAVAAELVEAFPPERVKAIGHELKARLNAGASE